MGNFFKAIALGLILGGALSGCTPRVSKEGSFRNALVAEKIEATDVQTALGQVDGFLSKQEELRAVAVLNELMKRFPSGPVNAAGESWKSDLLAEREKRLKSKVATFEHAVAQDKAAGFDPLGELHLHLDDQKYDLAMDDISKLATKLVSAKSAGEDLIQELRARQREQQALLRTRLDELESRLESSLLKARTPEDVKAVAGELTDLLREQKGATSAKDLQPELDAVSEIVARWQLFLYQLNAAHMVEAKAVRAELTKSLGVFQGLPLSATELAHRADDLLDDPTFLGSTAPTCQEILVKVKTLDDLDKAQAEFDQLRAWKSERVAQEEYAYLALLARTYRVVKWQRPLDLQPLMNGYAPKTPDFLRLREMLYLYTLPIYFDVTGEKAPQPGESSGAYLERVTQSSLDEHDWVLLKKIAEARKQLNDYQALLDSASLDFLISAENQEAGGQYVMEVMSYCRALISSSKLVPAKYIGQKLEQLKKDHPKEYAEATGLQTAAEKKETE